MSVGGGEHKTETDFDLNITPIIDCFTVLIAYLLISASFISIGFLDVAVMTPSESEQGLPDVTLTLEVQEGHTVAFKVSGADKREFAVKAKADGAWDEEQIQSRIEEIKAKWPQLAEAVVTAENKIQYREIVRVIQTVRKSLPKVYLENT
jgi:biopolymer transport protein ExbD